MMAKRLFVTKVRAESHAKLEEVLASGKYPRAECRETAEEYSVWSEPGAEDEKEVRDGG